jgi:hypothetical protein
VARAAGARVGKLAAVTSASLASASVVLASAGSPLPLPESLKSDAHETLEWAANASDALTASRSAIDALAARTLALHSAHGALAGALVSACIGK